ncbi:hypothetical protein WISP_28218 [Willisornis vidua]|uniref:Reverse transcriptase domain-containing protein n=1 Tax=Willisornis vidua TaxID=1566151 RepID=A0ABQ9DQH1_9PASS|nr:hypothetical protein WISP_28218 [Willisornis vidua]
MQQIFLKAILRHMMNREVIGDSHHDFSNSKSCLTNLVAFYKGVTAPVDNGRAIDVVCLDSCKAFDKLSLAKTPEFPNFTVFHHVEYEILNLAFLDNGSSFDHQQIGDTPSLQPVNWTTQLDAIGKLRIIEYPE